MAQGAALGIRPAPSQTLTEPNRDGVGVPSGAPGRRNRACGSCLRRGPVTTAARALRRDPAQLHLTRFPQFAPTLSPLEIAPCKSATSPP